ncbi:MAG TPA: S-formylglutathione hydrolase [Solimonas sp.]
MSLKQISANKCWGGTQHVYSHAAQETACTMRFSLFLPPQAQNGNKVPVLYWLSGLTCTEENFTVKAGAQRVAAELGLAIVAPDTSPRGLGIPGEGDNFAFGLGAGFYLDATQAPWSKGYRMYSYVTRELPALIAAEFSAQIDTSRSGIFGHSMGGHGALVCALRNPAQYKSVSAFAPISSPTRSDWGRHALNNYLGADTAAWAEYDSSLLLQAQGWAGPAILVDQGDKDQFINQLQPETLREAASAAGVALTLRLQPGYDHSYFFVQSFIADHLRHHAQHL